MFGTSWVNILDGGWADKAEELGQTFVGGPRLQEYGAFGGKAYFLNRLSSYSSFINKLRVPTQNSSVLRSHGFRGTSRNGYAA
jgi:hypothetical protein